MYEHNVPTVKILLQHGCHLQLTGFLQEKSVFASKFQSKTERDKAYKQWFQEQSVRKLFSSLRLTFNKLRPRKRKQYDVDAFAEFHFNRLNLFPETDDIFKILNLLFRCIPKLGREILNYPICPQHVVHHTTDALTWSRVIPEGILSWGSRYWDFDHEYWHFLNGLCNNGFLPAFLERTSQPAKLKHLCRCSIRKRLNENWQLPFGIQRLDMPKSLQKYLNIEED